jgi:hypothetical protein
LKRFRKKGARKVKDRRSQINQFLFNLESHAYLLRALFSHPTLNYQRQRKAGLRLVSFLWLGR